MERILVSACLLGHPVRYDGRGAGCGHPALARWEEEGRLIVFCPEVASGMGTPRPASEIAAGHDGFSVLNGRATVIQATGEDVTWHFVEGARQALEQAKTCHVRLAILKEGSPSCGTQEIYDGRFRNMRVNGPGVSAACLQRGGLRVFGENQIDAAVQCLRSLEHP